MPQEPSQLGGWLRQNWFLTLVVSFAVVLGFIQFAIQWAFRPPLVVTGVIAAIAIFVLFAFAVAVLHIRGPLADLRYRWLTRSVNRAMKNPSGKTKRPAA